MGRLAIAEQQQSYAGTFVYERNGSFSSHAVWQQVDGKRVQERFLQLDGAPAEVLLVDGQMQCATDELAAQVREAQAWHGQRLDPKALPNGTNSVRSVTLVSPAVLRWRLPSFRVTSIATDSSFTSIAKPHCRSSP